MLIWKTNVCILGYATAASRKQFGLFRLSISFLSVGAVRTFGPVDTKAESCPGDRITIQTFPYWNNEYRYLLFCTDFFFTFELEVGMKYSYNGSCKYHNHTFRLLLFDSHFTRYKLQLMCFCLSFFFDSFICFCLLVFFP